MQLPLLVAADLSTLYAQVTIQLAHGEQVVVVEGDQERLRRIPALDTRLGNHHVRCSGSGQDHTPSNVALGAELFGVYIAQWRQIGKISEACVGRPCRLYA